MEADTATKELLDRARLGDDKALESLLMAVQPQLYRFSMKMCRHPEDAQDVLQESMLAMARSFKDFRGGSSLSTWLFSIARNFCIKQRRKSKFAPKQEESLEQLKPTQKAMLTSTAPGPHQRAESAEVWRKVDAGIRKMDPSYREVLVLRDIEGLSAREVAEIIGVSTSAVKSRLHRARTQLRTQLATSVYKPKVECPDIRAVFSKHLEGELSSALCATMEDHIVQCSICASECDGLKAVISACANAPCEVTKSTQERVRLALRQIIHDTMI